MTSLGRTAAVACTAILAAAALPPTSQGPSPVRNPAPEAPDLEPDPQPRAADLAWLRFELGARSATVHATGEATQLELHELWRPMCSGAPEQMTREELERYALRHRLLARGPQVVVDSKPEAAGLDIVFNVSGSIPSGALAALSAIESYYQGLFTDPVVVPISVSFQIMSPGVLGGTSSTYGYVTYSGSRSGLVNGMDASDSIQSWLPTGSTYKVRYGSGSATTNEDRVFWTLANYNATVGSVAGTAANMTFNTNFTWDYDPSNGVTGGTYSFRDVVVHEVGHALGFTSGGDFRTKDSEVLDLFRFQRTDGTGDYNPDTLAEFQARPRLVARNAPNDAHNSDLISVEYRMSDGSPNQMSHFREQSANIGLMDPTLAAGETWHPAYFSTADAAMFDAIGYDR